MEKWGIWGLKRSKNMVLIGYGGVHWQKLPRKNGETWGKMGKPNQSTLAPQFLLFATPPPPHNTPLAGRKSGLIHHPPLLLKGPQARR